MSDPALNRPARQKGREGAAADQSLPDTSTPNRIIENESQNKTSKSGTWISRFGFFVRELDLDLTTGLMMMKAALPPTISLAIYQSTSAANTYTTLGYLIPIISIFSFCILPRARFIQAMIANVLATCLAAAFAMLMTWCGVQARINTSPTGTPAEPYNPSQSAVLGVWLFFQIYMVSTFRAKFPQFVFPTLIYAILINVAATFGTVFTTTPQAQAFVGRLLEAFLTGFAVAFIVSLFVIPVTSRKIVYKGTAAYIGTLRKYLKAHKSYLHSLEEIDMFSASLDVKEEGDAQSTPSHPDVAALKDLTAAVNELHAKLRGDVPLAKREIAYGNLSADDLGEIAKLLRGIMVPLVGLSALVDLFGRFAEINRWDAEKINDPEYESLRNQLITDWNVISQLVHEPFAAIFQAMDQGLEHTLLKLRLQKPPKNKNATMTGDIEAKGADVLPGDSTFSDYLSDQIDVFYQGKKVTLQEWCSHKGIKVSEDFFGEPENAEQNGFGLKRRPTIERRRTHRQLNVLLYMEFLLYSISRAILALTRFADKLEAEGRFSKPRLILPGKRRFKKWLIHIFRSEDIPDDDSATINGLDGSNAVIYMGQAFQTKRDPEHLPPQTPWERGGDFLRRIPRFFRSSESAFGCRCACATMSIAIIAYLQDTQAFFIKHRLLWALIMVSISMTPTAGQSVFGFLLRIVGTVLAMVVAFCIWYISGQHTAGVMVLFWIFVACAFYVPIKYPRYTIVGVIGVVTTTLIIGYELEVRKIGQEVASSNGQPYYPIYLLGPYRLATVTGGLAMAFIWTFFPFPINEHSALRQTLGAALYLSANYYSIVHETVMSRIRGDEGDLEDKTSPGYKLAKARNKVFSKYMLLSQALRTYSGFTSWELPLGGRFPKDDYDTIINSLSNIMRYTSLLAYASQTFTEDSMNNGQNESEARWFQDFRRVVVSANVTSHEITSMLALLSSSIKNGQPLPPYLKPPPPFRLSRELHALDDDILSVRHISELGYAAFAVIQISTRCINGDIEKLLTTVKKLVGELDFSFHIVSTNDGSEATSTTSTLFSPSSSRRKED